MWPMLRDIAHARSGDKGDRLNIAVFALRPRLYPILLSALTPETVEARFHWRRPGAVRRYTLPRLHAVNFVLDAALDGGINRSLGLDGHGKTLSFHLLGLPLALSESDLTIVREDIARGGEGA